MLAKLRSDRHKTTNPDLFKVLLEDYRLPSIGDRGGLDRTPTVKLIIRGRKEGRWWAYKLLTRTSNYTSNKP